MEADRPTLQQGEPKPTGLTEEEKLKLQLAWSEMTNVQLQIRILRGDLLQAERLLKEKVEALQQQRNEISIKYGIDPNTTTLDEHGNFIPISPEMRQAMVTNLPRF